MRYDIQYATLINKKELHHFPKTDLKCIKKAIEEKLTKHPEAFGKPLRFSLKGHRSLRIGNYRVIYRIGGRTVFIIIIAHRSVVYERYVELLESK